MARLVCDAKAIAGRWQAAITSTSPTGLEPPDLLPRLTALTEQIIAILGADELDVPHAREIGVAVAKLGFVLPDALGATLNTVGAELDAALTIDAAIELRPRLIALLSGLASGFSEQARAGILAEQDTVPRELLKMRNEMEEALRQSEERFHAIFQDAPVGITVTDLNGRIVQTNRALQSMLGYGADQFAGRPFTAFAHPSDAEHALQAFQQLIIGETERSEQELRFVHKTGAIVWGNVVFSLVKDAEGQPLFAIGMGEDITRRKEAEDERLQLIREQAARTDAEAAQKRLAFLVDVSTQLAASLDLPTTMESIARSAVPLLADWCTVNVVGASGMLEGVATAHIDPMKEALAIDMRRRYPSRQRRSPAMRVATTGASTLIPEVDDRMLDDISFDAEHRRLWQALAPRSVIIVPLTAHGRTRGTLSLIVTAESDRQYGPADLALAEDLGRRAAVAVENAQLYTRAEEAIRVRDEFLSVAAHELKTPVTSLRGFAQLTLRALDQEGQIDFKRLKQALTVVQQQSEKLTSLVAQLLDVSRFQSGKLAVECHETDLSELVLDLVARMQAQSDRHQLCAHVEPHVRANVDALRIEQVVTNLLDNAIKYSPEGGQVFVDLRTANGESIRIAVRDHGVGVPLEHRERIFERFYQAAEGHHRAGMGLGLYISRQIIELHRGQISAEFPDDGGSRFIVVLPSRI